MAIQVLDTQTILKIAAGEVIENPASVVKELVENAMDADARRISVEIRNGGKDSIRVTDDGTGLAADQIDLAFTRHATSKIRNYEDLFRIHSMGFRGEALPSIRAVADVTFISRTAETETGVSVRFRPEQDDEWGEVGHNVGTTISVEGLFRRIPVRAGFLKSALAESNRITELVYHFALARTDIAFQYIKDDKILLRTTGSQEKRTALAEMFGAHVADELLPIEIAFEHGAVRGFIGATSLYRGNRSFQYLYVNDRVIDEPLISKTVESAYSGKLPHGRYPVFFLWIDIDPNRIDINIHPNKKRVQWTDADPMLQALKEGVLAALDSQEDRNRLKEEEKPEKPERVNLYTMAEYKERRLTDRVSPKEAPLHRDRIAQPQIPYSPPPLPKREQPEQPHPSQMALPTYQAEEMNEVQNFLQRLRYMGVFDKTYLIFEDRDRKELVFLDQHAAHERILYDQMRSQSADSSRSQILLSPLTIRLSPQEIDRLEDRFSLFQSLGFEIERRGDVDILLRGVPFPFASLSDPRGLFYGLLDTLDREKSLPQEEKERALMKRACTEAVKSGDLLHSLSVEQLLTDLGHAEEPHTCPHGRPTYVRIAQKDVEKWFQRIPNL